MKNPSPTYELIGPELPEQKIRISPADLTVRFPVDLTPKELIALSQHAFDVLHQNIVDGLRSLRSSDDRT